MKVKNPQTILITGASSGIGEALALAYAESGKTLYLTGRDMERVHHVATQCREKGAKTTAIVLDVTDKVHMEKHLKEWDEKTPIDLIIANAGISGGSGDSAVDTPEQLERVFDVNVGGVFNTVMPIIPAMMKRKSGQIAIISSIAGLLPLPGAISYSASKAAVRYFGEGLHGQLKPHGVGVTVICPGFIKSRITDQNDFKMPFFMSADKAAQIIKTRLMKSPVRMVFPFRMHMTATVLSWLPACALSWVGQKMPKKKQLSEQKNET